MAEEEVRAQPDRLLKIREVAEILGLSHYSVYKLVWNGQLNGVRLGTRQRVAESEVRRYIADNSHTSKPEGRKVSPPPTAKRRGRPRKEVPAND